MEQIVKLHIEKLPEGFFLATSDEIPGLVAQGRTLTETLEIARDVARRLLEARAERQDHTLLSPPGDRFDYPPDHRRLMGRLGGFCYRDVVSRLKRLGFAFDRQTAGIPRGTGYVTPSRTFHPRQTLGGQPNVPDGAHARSSQEGCSTARDGVCHCRAGRGMSPRPERFTRGAQG